MDGKRGRGRRRKSWNDNVSEMTQMSMAQCSVKALDRSEWGTMVSNLYAETTLRLFETQQSRKEASRSFRMLRARNNDLGSHAKGLVRETKP